MVTTPKALADTFSNAAQPHAVVGPWAVPGEWDRCMWFCQAPNSFDKCKVRLHGAVTIHRETLGLRPRDQSCHHEVGQHLDLVGNQCAHEPRGNHEHRVLLKERSCPYQPKKEKGRYDDESDRSFSFVSSVREPLLP